MVATRSQRKKIQQLPEDISAASTHTLSDRFATLPEELFCMVLDQLDYCSMCSLAAVSKDLGVAVSPHVQGAALYCFLCELIALIEAFYSDTHAPWFSWADQCKWVAEWREVVTADSVVAWLEALPKDDDGLPTGADPPAY